MPEEAKITTGQLTLWANFNQIEEETTLAFQPSMAEGGISFCVFLFSSKKNCLSL
jgi:hypothetical protein